MEKWEYGELWSTSDGEFRWWSLEISGNRFVLGAETALTPAAEAKLTEIRKLSRLAAFNFVGRDGWIVGEYVPGSLTHTIIAYGEGLTNAMVERLERRSRVSRPARPYRPTLPNAVNS